MFRLRFPASRLGYWAGRFPTRADEEILHVAAAARKRGFLTKREFMALGEWKTPRTRQRRAQNSEALVREATRAALAAKSEELKIGVLRLLSGVDWPTASVILHLCDRGKYPILDTRALWSTGHSAPAAYSFDLWLAYTKLTRALAKGAGCTMREVDRALWQFAKEHQPDA
jgi:hypothetical protein